MESILAKYEQTLRKDMSTARFIFTAVKVVNVLSFLDIIVDSAWTQTVILN